MILDLKGRVVRKLLIFVLIGTAILLGTQEFFPKYTLFAHMFNGGLFASMFTKIEFRRGKEQSGVQERDAQDTP